MLRYAIQITNFTKDVEYARCNLDAIVTALDEIDYYDMANAVRLVSEKLNDTANGMDTLFNDFHREIRERGLVK